MTRSVRITPSLVRFAPPGVDAATGTPDQMIFTSEYGGIFNVVASGTLTTNNTNTIAIPAGIANPFVLARGRCLAAAGNVPNGWSVSNSLVDSTLWLTAVLPGGGQAAEFWVEELNPQGVMFRTALYPQIFQGAVQITPNPNEAQYRFLTVEYDVMILNGNI